MQVINWILTLMSSIIMVDMKTLVCWLEASQEHWMSVSSLTGCYVVNEVWNPLTGNKLDTEVDELNQNDRYGNLSLSV